MRGFPQRAVLHATFHPEFAAQLITAGFALSGANKDCGYARERQTIDFRYLKLWSGRHDFGLRRAKNCFGAWSFARFQQSCPITRNDTVSYRYICGSNRGWAPAQPLCHQSVCFQAEPPHYREFSTGLRRFGRCIQRHADFRVLSVIASKTAGRSQE